MARTAQQPVKPAQLDIDALVESLYAGQAPSNPEPKVGLTRRLFQVTGNALADSGDLFASVGAGARASVANYKVARETEYQRQMERTKARLRLMLEQ